MNMDLFFYRNFENFYFLCMCILVFFLELGLVFGLVFIRGGGGVVIGGGFCFIWVLSFLFLKGGD